MAATDPRASVGLILAASAVKEQTLVNHIRHLDRGYEDVTGEPPASASIFRD